MPILIATMRVSLSPSVRLSGRRWPDACSATLSTEYSKSNRPPLKIEARYFVLFLRLIKGNLSHAFFIFRKSTIFDLDSGGISWGRGFYGAKAKCDSVVNKFVPNDKRVSAASSAAAHAPPPTDRPLGKTKGDMGRAEEVEMRPLAALAPREDEDEIEDDDFPSSPPSGGVLAASSGRRRVPARPSSSSSSSSSPGASSWSSRLPSCRSALLGVLGVLAMLATY